MHPARVGWPAVFCVALLCMGAPALAAPLVFWNDLNTGKIERINGDGTDRRPIASGQGPTGVAVDPVRGHVYWIDEDAAVIRRANLDGSNPLVAVSNLIDSVGTGSHLGLAVNPLAGHLYWTQGNEGDVRRSNLDGSNTILIFDRPDVSPDGIAVDPVGGKVYWVENAGPVRRANLDGSNAETIATYGSALGSGASGIVVDPDARKLYVSLVGSGRIDRLNLDGTGRETAVDVAGQRPFGLAIDTEADKLYWVSDFSTIRRANLNGTNVETVVTGLQSAREIAVVVPEPAAALPILILSLHIITRRRKR